MTEKRLIHLPLTDDAHSIATRCDVTNHGVEFGAPGPGGQLQSAALFRDRRSYLEIPDGDWLRLADGDFSIAAWVCTEATADVIGDLVSKFDHEKRRGFSLSVISHAESSSRSLRRAKSCGPK